jgi:hypothetical protein
MFGKFVGLGIVVVLLNLAIGAAMIAGGVWLTVYMLRSLGVIA